MLPAKHTCTVHLACVPQSPTCPRPRTPNSKSASNQRSQFSADYVMLASLTLAPGEIMSRDSTCRMASAQPPHVNFDPANGMPVSASDMWRTKGQQPVRTFRSTLVQGLFHTRPGPIDILSFIIPPSTGFDINSVSFISVLLSLCLCCVSPSSCCPFRSVIHTSARNERLIQPCPQGSGSQPPAGPR